MPKTDILSNTVCFENTGDMAGDCFGSDSKPEILPVVDISASSQLDGLNPDANDSDTESDEHSLKLPVKNSSKKLVRIKFWDCVAGKLTSRSATPARLRLSNSC